MSNDEPRPYQHFSFPPPHINQTVITSQKAFFERLWGYLPFCRRKKQLTMARTMRDSILILFILVYIGDAIIRSSSVSEIIKLE